jgi:hypothetical protein
MKYFRVLFTSGAVKTLSIPNTIHRDCKKLEGKKEYRLLHLEDGYEYPSLLGAVAGTEKLFVSYFYKL